MMDIAYWIAAGAAAGALVQTIRCVVGRARRDAVTEARCFTCPASRGEVHCMLVRDGDSTEWIRVARCSASNPSGRPDCDQNCVRILNMGIPLHPVRRKEPFDA